MPVLKFYTKPDCSLCNDVRDILNESGAEWEEVNILENLDLWTRYRDEIPVVQSSNQIWFYRERDTISLTHWLENQKRNNCQE